MATSMVMDHQNFVPSHAVIFPVINYRHDCNVNSRLYMLMSVDFNFRYRVFANKIFSSMLETSMDMWLYRWIFFIYKNVISCSVLNQQIQAIKKNAIWTLGDKIYEPKKELLLSFSTSTKEAQVLVSHISRTLEGVPLIKNYKSLQIYIVKSDYILWLNGDLESQLRASRCIHLT